MAHWGIIGTGRITGKFVTALAASASERVVAIASRDADRAAAAAQALGIPTSYGSYAALLADPEVQAVYIALPPSMHAEWSIAALAAGKHVLCEKPLATSYTEAVAMFETARQHRRWLMEGFMYRFHPQTRTVERLISEGAIGAVRLVRVAFGISIADPGNIRLSADLGGGALGDVGCYCVSMARLAAGAAPTRVSATARYSASGVDELLVGTLEYTSGTVAQISCGLGLSRHQRTQIVGDAGSIELDESFSIAPDQELSIRLLRGGARPTEERIPIPAADHFRLEAEGFSALIAAGPEAHGLPAMPPAESLDTIATMDALRRSAREGRPVELGFPPARAGQPGER
ncbi:MAG: Gfo/Idh/MocA family oxidoreductase [Chloroflexi bacterium OHK40]